MALTIWESLTALAPGELSSAISLGNDNQSRVAGEVLKTPFL